MGGKDSNFPFRTTYPSGLYGFYLRIKDWIKNFLKRFSFLKIRGIVLLALLLVGIFTGVSEAKKFQWGNDNICTPTTVCGSYIYVWTLESYCSMVPTDCNYDTRNYTQVPGGKGILVPSDKQSILKKEGSYLIKVRVLPESYEIVSVEITKKIFPVPYNTKYVSVVVAYERETTGDNAGRELESDFSNRIMWASPRVLDFIIEIINSRISLLK